MTIFDWLDEKGIEYKTKYFIECAFIHSSYVNENKGTKCDNERLEFVGDAVLQLWTSKKLFALLPKLDEGKMTTLRASIVCEEALAEYGRKLKLNQFLKLGQGEEKSGGREKDSLIANMFEAFIGALYIDNGSASTDKLLKEVLDFSSVNEVKPMLIDYKTQLQEYVQADSKKTVQYVVLNTTGPSNNPKFEVAVKLDGIVLGKGNGTSKKKAEQQAAKSAFEKLVR